MWQTIQGAVVLRVLWRLGGGPFKKLAVLLVLLVGTVQFPEVHSVQFSLFLSLKLYWFIVLLNCPVRFWKLNSWYMGKIGKPFLYQCVL